MSESATNLNSSRSGSLLRSQNLESRGFAHAFSTRIGGASGPPFEELNFGGPESAPDRLENIRRLSTIGFDPALLYEVTQVHGACVREAEGLPSALRAAEADALIARMPGVAVAVRIADCVPILVGDDTSGHVSAIHAGWRGVVSGVIGDAVGMLTHDPAACVVGIGPSIGECCFEVSLDVARAIADASAPSVIVSRGADKAMVSLRAATRFQLVRAGIPDASIEDVPGCTRCEPSRFYSYRRDGERSGRLIAAIVGRGSSL